MDAIDHHSPADRLYGSAPTYQVAAAEPDRSRTQTTASPVGVDPVAVVEALYVAFERGDMAAVGQLVDPAIEWIYHAPSSLMPLGGRWQGLAGIEAFDSAVRGLLTDVKLSRRALLASGEWVAVVGKESSTVIASQQRYEVDNVQLWRVQGGRIVRFEEFTDSARVFESMRLAPQPRRP